ncbi:MAG: response regulator [Alcanivoracaceae bacterium]|jgi:CheY-like chemotaxis protein|nr:response regulator [Alcanivoracaceae bacterium]
MTDLINLLYVDDDEDISSIVELAFDGDERFHLTICLSGQEALVVARKAPPDMVLLDVMMPDMDGRTTYRELRAIPSLTDIPVIFLTAKVQPAELQELFQLGATDVIAKPFEALSLPDRLLAIKRR